MNNNRCDIEDIEQLLSPQCKFRASDDLKIKIMDEAEALSKVRRLRIIPWLAAACIAGVIVMVMTYVHSGDEITSSPQLIAAIEPPTIVPSPTKTAKTVEETVPDLRKPQETKKRKAIVAKTADIVNPPADDNVDIQPDEAIKATDKITEKEEPIMVGAMPMGRKQTENQIPTILAETDITITNPENLEYTSEEIAQIKRMAQEAYINRVILNVEIAEHLINENSKI